MSLGFVRQDIGLALLGALISSVASALVLYSEFFALLLAPSALLTLGALWHLGWRLAFPPRTQRARKPMSPRREGLLMMLGGFAAVVAATGVAVLLLAQ